MSWHHEQQSSSMTGIRLEEMIGARLRKIGLTIVLCVSLVANLTFAAAGLATTTGIYTLMAYLALVGALLHALSATAGGSAALSGRGELDLERGGQTASNLTPRRAAAAAAEADISFVPYVGVWLVWWVISELFKSALVLYGDSIVWQFFVFPALVLASTWHRQSRTALILLRGATLVTLAFPTAAWAPQHSTVLLVALRVAIYTLAVFLFDFLDQGSSTPQRAGVIATLNAWILVSPMIVATLGVLMTTMLFVASQQKTMGLLAPLTSEAAFDSTTAKPTGGGVASNEAVSSVGLPPVSAPASLPHQHHLAPISNLRGLRSGTNSSGPPSGVAAATSRASAAASGGAQSSFGGYQDNATAAQQQQQQNSLPNGGNATQRISRQTMFS